MLTLALTEPQRTSGGVGAGSRSSLALRRSRTSSPNGPSLATSPTENEAMLTMHAPGAARPLPIPPISITSPPAPHSPRTTRRNMLATELPESLRKHLLWERKQKNTTAHAVFKRRHTAQNLAILHEHPGSRNGPAGQDSSRNNSWN